MSFLSWSLLNGKVIVPSTLLCHEASRHGDFLSKQSLSKSLALCIDAKGACPPAAQRFFQEEVEAFHSWQLVTSDFACAKLLEPILHALCGKESVEEIIGFLASGQNADICCITFVTAS